MKKIVLMLLAAVVSLAAYSDKAVPMAKLEAPQKASVNYLDIVGQYLWFYQTAREFTTDPSSVTSALTSVEVSIQPSETTEGGVTISGMFPNDLEGKVVNLAGDGPCLEIEMGQMGGTDDFYGDYTIEGMNYFDEDDVPAGWYRQDIHGMIGDDAITFDSWIVTRLTGSTGQFTGMLKQPLYLPGSTLMTDLRLVELPEGAEVKDYTLTYTDYFNKSVSEPARVAIDGDDVYFQGMSKFFPEAWVKGKKVGDKVKFPMKQYVGNDEDFGLTFAFCNCPVEFTYDETSDTYSFGSLLYGILGGRYYDGYFNKPVLKGVDNRPKTPANPVISTFGQHTDGGWYIAFNVPLLDTEGSPLLSYYLTYEIYSNIEGEEKPLTFTPATHTNLYESMTEIPYGFTDNWDFGMTSEGYVVFFNGLYSERWNKVGVKSIYRGGGETRESDIQWYEIKPCTWGDMTDQCVPSRTSESFGITQQIYTRADFGEAKTITSISFYSTGSVSTRQLDIFMVTVDPSFDHFSSYGEWVPFSASDRVFYGAVEFKKDDWTVIPFTKPFNYDGENNVVLVVTDNTGVGTYWMYCRVYEAEGMTHWSGNNYKRYVPDAEITDYSPIFDVKNQFRLNESGLDPSPRPTSIVSSDVTWDGATVTWESDAAKWNLQYKKALNEEEWTTVSGLTDKTYHFSGLNEQTSYYVRVQDVDDEGHGSPWAICGFLTPERYKAPTDLKILNIEEHSATFAWTDNADATRWQLRVGNKNYVVDSNPCTITDLVADKNYTAYVRVYYGADHRSSWTKTINFKTYAGDNPAPKLLSISVSPTSPTLTWWGKSDKYVVEYRKNGTDEWMTMETTTREITIPDLEPNTHYECQIVGIKAGCQDAITKVQTLYTPALNEAPIREDAEAGYNTATIWWEGVSDAFIVQYHPEGSDEVKTAWTTGKEVTLTGLTPNTRYSYTITGLKAGCDDASTSPRTFTTKAYQATNITLYDNGSNWNTINDHNREYANVTIQNRVFKKNGKWQTVCLPFGLRVKGSVLDGAEVRTLDNVQMLRGVVTLECYTPVKEMLAATPYIIRWPAGSGSNIVNPRFEGVTLLNDEAPNLASGRLNHVVFGGGCNYFILTDESMESLAMSGVDYYFLSGDPILSSAEVGSEMRAFDGYFIVENDVIMFDYVVLDTGEEDDLITEINGPTPDASPRSGEDEAIYNLAGQRIQKLQKGINIVNGKKILVK